MQFFRLVAALALAGTVAACTTPTTDIQRGIGGAIAGAVISDATGGNAATGALVGGGAGLLCDDVGLCQ